ncbi:UDP-N-acetylmuramoyl-tripeptide--D-alanyl-D-alanine ligase [Evansella caseinilytica]|uniref:UDP-N-acetylmuramoyl-tripeptide--D-alanyl-D-alanine ligase n=1 Tax=Evansella caseinilytica TaxID=1503961 RepID=A0A1H3RWX9_9BACI|nr:UDP-N-acetylmuramoyl-tripeptide--D-alanyl-D-alanine ligase [Evansella caseinilytica]SDZ30216.1 UDP-N-acetylmuramoyl-tripeptide--D-alanyl-D-alanine ligase [Evansella caseinilytica]
MITMMKIIMILIWMLPVAAKMIKSVHMLQLNSYRNERYLLWISRNRTKVFQKRDTLLAVPVLLSFIGNAYLTLLSAVFTFIVLFLIRGKTTEKKKLVYTARVKRLLVTTFIVYGILGAVAFFLPDAYSIALLAISLVMGYYVLLLANTINLPIEKQINEYYFSDAKKRLRASKNLKVIGITGSFGKTSVKHFMHAILVSKFNVLMTPESYNTKLGVTRTVREQLKPYHEIFIAEMGAKQTGDIKEICELAEQDYGVLTAVGEQHLETFKSLENIQKTKHEIIETLPENGVGVLNMDDENIMSYQPKNPCRKVYYGMKAEEADIRAKDISYSNKGMDFTVVLKTGEMQTFRTKLLGEHNVYNILAGIAIALEMGMTLQEMIKPIRNLEAVPHRLELKRTSGKITIIDDSFNSNPVGSKMAVDVLGSMDGFKMLVTPGMIELGEKEYELNKEWAMYAAAKCDYIILVGKRQTKPLQDGLKEVNYPEAQYYVAEHLNDAISHMHQVAKEKTIVLLENDLPDTFNE